jgi:hypothetical protein
LISVGVGFGAPLSDLVEVGARDDLAPCTFELLHDPRIPVELLIGRLLDGKFLIDEPFEYLPACRRSLGRSQTALLRQARS